MGKYESERKNIIEKKSFDFAVRIVNLNKYLNNKNEYILSKQLLRSGTSIGANIEEAEGAITKKDFLNKIYTAHKEARETSFWLELLHETNYLNDKEFISIFNDCEELIKLTGKIISTTNKSLDK
jgi:four helix bundle protein